MQLRIVLILFLFNFCQVLTDANKSSFQISKTTANTSDIDDTPSPEWIKYQWERYQNSDKLSSVYQELNKEQTTSRQEDSQQKKTEQIVFENNSKYAEESAPEQKTSLVEFPSIQGFIEFIKSLKQTWMKNSLFRIDDKIKMLYKLKDSLLKTIEHQFMILWQDDDDDANVAAQTTETKQIGQDKLGSHLRSKRGILDESNINFPPEAALMSINFLTFAVFLIKLVLQVVNIVKTKHYRFSTLNMDTGAIRNG